MCSSREPPFCPAFPPPRSRSEVLGHCPPGQGAGRVSGLGCGRADEGLLSTARAGRGHALGSCGDSSGGFPGAELAGLMSSGHAVARPWAGAAGQPEPVPADRASQRRSGFDSLLQPPLEGRRMPGIRQGPWEPGAAPHCKGVLRPGSGAWPDRDPAQSPGGARALPPTSDLRLCRQCPGGRTGSRCGAARRGPSRRRASVTLCWSGAPG